MSRGHVEEVNKIVKRNFKVNGAKEEGEWKANSILPEFELIQMLLDILLGILMILLA